MSRAFTTTDNNGRFTLLVHPPQAEVFLNIGNATIHKSRIPVSPSAVTKVDDLFGRTRRLAA